MTLAQAFGIRNIKLPIRVKQRAGGIQHSIASIQLQVSATHNNSEHIIPVLTERLSQFSGDFSVTSYNGLLEKIRCDLGSETIRLQLNFPYFINKQAPVSGTSSLLEYSCSFDGSVGSNAAFKLCVQVPVTTLCPCSREISKFGAHNQRAEVTFCIRYNGFIWLEELIEMVEASASCELYALLKRPDEKYVTEKAYANPMFVEDVVRKLAVAADKHPLIDWFSAGVESFESIHKHSAYAFVDSDQIR